MKHFYLTLLLAIGVNTSHADLFLGIFVGIGQWNQSFTGDVNTLGTNLAISDDLGVEDAKGNTQYAALEHSIPFIPNVRLSIIELESSGSETLTREFTFGGETYTQGIQATTNIDLSHEELVLYYEILDNWVNLDVGLAFKMFGGDLQITANGTNAREDLDGTLPMLYARGAFELPFTNWRADVEASMFSVSGNTVSDMSAEIAYEGFIGLGAELGYRVFNLDIDDLNDDLVVNTSFKGVYFNVYYHF